MHVLIMLSKITAHNISATTSALSFSPSHQFAAVPCSQHRHILIYPNVLYVDDQFANRANHPIALTLPAIQRPRSRFYWTVPATDFKFALLENDRTIAKHGRSNCKDIESFVHYVRTLIIIYKCHIMEIFCAIPLVVRLVITLHVLEVHLPTIV